jgi:hypothetical protein
MFTEDLDEFYDLDDFAEEATYDRDTVILVIFDNEYAEALDGIAGRAPVARCQASSVDADPTGKPLKLRGVNYTIRNVQPIDDGAEVLLILEAPELHLP